MVHVRDVVQAALLAATRPEAIGQTLIVADGEAYSTRRIYELICAALGRRVPSWSVPNWVLRAAALAGDGIGAVRGRRFPLDSDSLNKLLESAWFSCEKLQNELGFRPQWNLEKALPEMIRAMTKSGLSTEGDGSRQLQ